MLRSRVLSRKAMLRLKRARRSPGRVSRRVVSVYDICDSRLKEMKNLSNKIHLIISDCYDNVAEQYGERGEEVKSLVSLEEDIDSLNRKISDMYRNHSAHKRVSRILIDKPLRFGKKKSRGF